MQNVFIYVFIHGNKYKLIDIINILELIFIINMLINIYYSNTNTYTANTNQHKPMYCNSTCHTYIIIQYIEHISS